MMKKLRLLIFTLVPLVLLSFLVVSTKADSSFIVNSNLDGVDANPGDGICETGPGNDQCTLRAAVMEANAYPGENTINLPADTYTFDVTGNTEDAVSRLAGLAATFLP